MSQARLNPSWQRTAIASLLASTVLVSSAAAQTQQDGRPAPARPQPQAPAGAANGNATEQSQPGSTPQRPTNNISVPVRREAQDGLIPLAFNEASVEEIIPYISVATGKVVIPINLSLLRGKKITLMNDEPVPAAAALDLMFTALRLNGIGVIETDEVVILDMIDNIKIQQPPVLSADHDVMARDDLGTFVVKIFRLTEAPAEGVGERLQANLPGYATLEVDPNSNQIILYGDIGLAQHMQRLINELDRNSVVVKTQTFRLAYADAQAVADQIYELFEETTDASVNQGVRGPRNVGGRRGAAPQPGGSQPPTASLTGPGPSVQLRVSVNNWQNSVTVSAEPVKIDAIAKLIHEEWDLPRPEETFRVYELAHTDPIKIRDLIQNMMGVGSGGVGRAGSALGRAGGARGIQAGSAGAAGPSAIEVLSDIYRVEAYPDRNSVVVMSKTPEALDYLDKFIAANDRPSSVGVPEVVELKHANAINLAQELNVLLAETGTGLGLDAPGSGLTGEGIGGMDDSSGGLAGGAIGGTGRGGSGGAGSAGTIEFPWQRGRPRDDQAEPSSLIGKIRIVPIVRQNALAVVAPAQYRQPIIDLIHEFDKPGRQVMISAIIAEVELNDDLALGLRLSSEEIVSSVSDNSVRGSFGFEGSEEGVLDSLFDTSVLDVNANINVLLQALRQKTNVRILQEPRVFTADNQEAYFFDGQDVPFITNSNTTDIGGITQSFDYKQVGVVLNVRPRITAERAVDMEINLELSSIVPGQTLFGGFILDRRQTTTKVIVENGQTIVLSGILTDSESRIKRGIPLLSELPLIGDLFAAHENTKRTSELVAFITPIVVDNPSENDSNFNAAARERLRELSKPLKEQTKQRNTIRERIVTPGPEREPVSLQGDDDDEADRSRIRRNDQEDSGADRGKEPNTSPPAPVDVDNVNSE